jgi:hypothetical protein
MDELLNPYTIERQFRRADYYCDEDEEGSLTIKDIFLPPAKELDILKCEKLLKCQLPKSYRNFLLIHNGALIHTSDFNLHGELNYVDWVYTPASRIIMGTVYLVRFTNEQEERYYSLYEESWEDYNKRWANLIPFCYCGAEGDGSFLALDPTQADGDEYPILYCLSTENIEEWRSEIYYPSFKDFFLDILSSTEILEDYKFLDKYLKSLEEST